MTDYIDQFPLIIVSLIFILSLFILSRSADKLIDKAVALSLKMGLSKVVVGATILSIGTTLPEVASSVAAALGGNGEFGLGNAVGSMITNASLVLGIGALGGVIPVRKGMQQTFVFLSTLSVTFVATSYLAGTGAEGGLLPRWSGIVLLILLPIYLGYTVKKKPLPAEGELVADTQAAGDEKGSEALLPALLIMLLSSLGVTLGATLLVSTAEVGAARLGIPDSVISSTIVAFGTSVPEVTTTLVAVRYGHGELAIGNVLGANMMNLLLVMGLTISLLPGGVFVPASYYLIQFPILAAVFMLLSIPILSKRVEAIRRRQGLLLIGLYLVYLITNFL
ncbi:Sodium/calcium exchanger [Alkalibacterium sp. AK22]|uniref:sodium:calcium antiporter n=1 Tax=Alkalibacterium sp. AK22 TaxID=1229520 RepID=UPI00044B658C|nr:sodium:calcium antiporter [Alkalibacterium sp. AK22]EXJ24388.1 Sodium/calcium exchanger [Alkalibacterium sp. AK22]